MAGSVFREPVFIRNDDETQIAASVVEWGDDIGGFSIRLSTEGASVLILAEDWGRIKSCLDCELNRVGAFDQ